jgi:hypothetical protein
MTAHTTDAGCCMLGSRLRVQQPAGHGADLVEEPVCGTAL